MAKGMVRPPGGGPWRRRVAVIKARRVFQLYLSHYGSIRDIAAHPQVQLSPTRVHQIIQEGMQEAATELKELTFHATELRMMNLREMKYAAREALTRRCPVCRGNTSEVGAPPCEVCADTGYFYEHSDRMQAADRLLRAMQEEARLLGAYPAEERTLNLTVDRSLLERMAELPESELDEIIELYADGSEPAERPLEVEPASTRVVA